VQFDGSAVQLHTAFHNHQSKPGARALANVRATPEGLEKLLSWVRERHGDGPLEDDFSIVRIQF